MTTVHVFLISALMAISLMTATSVEAQDADVSLTDRVLQLDSLVFSAFNNRNFEVHLEFFSEDLEFFHDESGLSNYKSFVESTRRLFDLENPLTRTLVPGSTVVHPVPHYGAIQIGSHKFCHMENGAQDCGVFDFVHVWQLHGDRWQITRVLSYGH